MTESVASQSNSAMEEPEQNTTKGSVDTVESKIAHTSVGNARDNLLARIPDSYGLAKAKDLIASARVPEDLSFRSLKPSLSKRSPVYQAWLYPLFGVHRLLTDWQTGKPIIKATSIALGQSIVITGGYCYISFKYVFWFVKNHLLNFSYFNLRPFFRLIERLSGENISTDTMEWWTAAILTLAQAAILSNSLVGYKIRAQGKTAGEAVLASKARRQPNIKTEEKVEKRRSGNFIFRFIYNSLWTTFITPIYTIPVVGQLLFAYLRAPAITGRYLAMFRAHDLGKAHRYSAIGFGVVAGLLQSTPFVGHLFSITNSVGAAMWIQDLEQEAEDNDDDQAAAQLNAS